MRLTILGKDRSFCTHCIRDTERLADQKQCQIHSEKQDSIDKETFITIPTGEMSSNEYRRYEIERNCITFVGLYEHLCYFQCASGKASLLQGDHRRLMLNAAQA